MSRSPHRPCLDQEPAQCSLCGAYLTDDPRYAAFRCANPAHWSYTGLLLAARRLLELDQAQAAETERDTELARRLAMDKYRRWHCPGCDQEFDTYAVDTCPHCGEDLSLPF